MLLGLPCMTALDMASLAIQKRWRDTRELFEEKSAETFRLHLMPCSSEVCCRSNCRAAGSPPLPMIGWKSFLECFPDNFMESESNSRKCSNDFFVACVDFFGSSGEGVRAGTPEAGRGARLPPGENFLSRLSRERSPLPTGSFLPFADFPFFGGCALFSGFFRCFLAAFTLSGVLFVFSSHPQEIP